MSNDSSTVAPKERVNITYKPKTGDQTEEIELPLKLLMLGDYTQQEDDTPLGEREAIEINKINFNDVLKGQNLSVDMTIKDCLSGNEDSQLAVKLDIENMKSFRPENIVENLKPQGDEKQEPVLKKLMDLRKALIDLKGPLANVPKFRNELQALIEDKDKLNQLLAELDIADKK